MSNSPITVLIEQPGFVPFNNALRRSSITPYGRNNLNYSTTSATTSGSSPRNSINAGNATPTTPETATTNLGRNPNRSSISSAGNHTTKEWNRRQRTSTTFHASIDVPDSLLAALSSIAIVNVQPSLSPLPTARPLVVLIQLNDYIPQELSTTPSTVCFPPNATPTKQSVQRAIQPLKTAISQLPRGEVALLLYSDNAHLPPEIPQAAFADGAHGLLTPPFTPDSVESSLHAALDLFQKTKNDIRRPTRHLPTLPEPTDRPERRKKDREHHKWDSLDSFTLDSSSSHASASASDPHSPILAEHDTDAIDPLDTSRRRRSMIPAPLDADADTGPFAFANGAAFPIPDHFSPRRASVDLGGLQLALPKRSSETIVSPSSPRASSSSGWGWAGFDTSPVIVGLDLAGNGPGAGPWGRRGTVVPGRPSDARTLGKKKSVGKVGMFEDDDEEEDGDGLGVADLLLAMHLHGSAALENAAALSQGIPPSNNGPSSSSYFSDAPVQRRQSSPAERSPYGNYSNPNGSHTSAIPPLPFPSILSATPRTLSRLRALLSSWHFEPYLLSPPETLLCVQLIFEALLGALKLSKAPPSSNEPSFADITMSTHLVPFLTDLMRLYRRENRYHSFVHALDVLQAVYTFLELQGRVDSVAVAFLDGSAEEGSAVGMIGKGSGQVKSPLSLLSDDDLFLLCLAAIGHDVGHPGNSNAFLKNAQAPLSKLYEDKSALERMHCTLLLRLLRKHGMGHLISTQTERGREGRWLIVGTVLATDMSWHFEWVERFGRAMKDRRTKDQRRGSTSLVVNSSASGAWVVVEQEEDQLPTADNRPETPIPQEEVDREDRLFLCQAMMKCADISNPCRPHNISRHWSTVLLEEWAAQALLERHLGLPVSVVADANEKVQCVGQVSFIKLFTQPLFDIVSEALPGLSVIAKHCTENRILWENKLANFEAIASAASAPPSRTSTSSTSSTKSTQQMIRPIPLALPILPSMARYAKTVFPLSLPSLRTKRQPPAARALASMSPWHAVSQGKKRAGGMTASTTTGTSRSNNSGTSGPSARTSGSGNVRLHSRPDSFSSTSTLSSVGGGTGSGLSPTTPTSIGRQSSFYGRSPVSPLMSPFSMAVAASGGAQASSATTGAGGERALPLSVWDVDPVFAEELRKEVRVAWGIRDGKYRKRMRVRGREGLEEDEDGFMARRGSLDITIGR